MKTNFTIRQEESKDFFTVENLVREAFWNVYQPGCDEHFIVNQYRDNPDFIKELSLVLELDNKIIGYIMFSKAQIDCDNGTKLDVVTFGPLAIHPDFQRKGFGKILVDYSLEKALATVGSDFHRDIERQMAAAAVTVVQNKNNTPTLRTRSLEC